MPPDCVLAYAAAVTEELLTASGGLLQAAYLHGSAVLGGWQPASDVDMLFVAADSVAASTLARMAAVLAARSDRADGCPGRACRAMVYLTDDAIVSKIAGGEAALDLGFGPAEVITRALSQQLGRAARMQPDDEAAEFVLATAAALRDACGLNYRP